MVEKLNELNNRPKDPNSPESQKFLREIHEESIRHQEKMKKMIETWHREDLRNESSWDRWSR